MQKCNCRILKQSFLCNFFFFNLEEMFYAHFKSSSSSLSLPSLYILYLCDTTSVLGIHESVGATANGKYCWTSKRCWSFANVESELTIML